MSSIEISQLLIYPAKSMGHLSLNASDVDRFGLHNDRRWMLVDRDGVYISQRKQPRMCLIKSSLEGDQLMLETAEIGSISVAKASSKKTVKVKVWGDECIAHDCGDHAADWLSGFLKIDCRLVYFPDNENRLMDQNYAKPEEYTAFSDGFPFLLISQASLDDLNGRLDVPVAMTRFRPNLVVSGCEAFAEDGWQQIKVGGLILRVVKPCSRCVIPNIDTATGEKGAEPIKTLSQYRKRDNKVFFGQNVIANSTGRLEVGMKIELGK